LLFSALLDLLMTATISHHRLPVEGGQLPLMIARGDGGGASVVIVPSAYGVGSDLEAQMKEAAAASPLVVAVDPFFREDAGAATYDERPRIMARLQALDRERGYRDLRTALDWIRGEQPGRPLVIVGICFGGGYALRAAADRLVDGVVTWHGSRMEQHLEGAERMRCPMRLHFGGADPFVPPATVDAVGKALAGKPDVRIVVHEGATHGFSHRGSPHAYDEPAERAGMDSLRELIASAGG
jgi:carboxymethylenebutenolidase